MGLETGTYVEDLVATNPVGTDAKSAGDDHFRLIKSVLKATFPGMSGALLRVLLKSANYTLLATDNTVLVDCSAALTLSLTAAATLGNKWLIVVSSRGGDVLIDPNGAETINGATTLTLPKGSFAFVWCNGSTFYAVTLPENATKVGASTTSGTLIFADAGKCVKLSAGITIPANVFNEGDVVSLYNDTSGSLTITQGASLTLRRVGSSDTGNRTLTQRGLVSVWFVSATEAVISGGGLN